MEIANNFTAKQWRGQVQADGSGSGGSGSRFDAEGEELRNAERKVRALLQPLCAYPTSCADAAHECPPHRSQQRL